MAVLTDYVEAAFEQAVLEELEKGSYGARIPGCAGVIAFGSTFQECENNLRSTLED